VFCRSKADLRGMLVRCLPLLLLSCGATRSPGPVASALPYDLGKPTSTFTLPDLLIEISALTDVDSNTVACVQDEAATMYTISLTDGVVVGTYPFGGPADMEGLTKVKGDYYALRSDGLVYHLRFKPQEAESLAVVDTFRLEVPNHNIEGLGYDERNHRVLVSPKDFVKGSKEGRDERVLYAFDPKDPMHKADTVLRLSIQGLIAQANASGITVPERKAGNDRVVPALKLRYSSVAVHPITDHYYLLSAVDRTLLVVDRNGKLIALEQLDGQLLPKPEGITFMANGDLVLSSEGKRLRPGSSGASAPVIARYRYRPN
jgi:uncharacterized protein YjiK